MTSLFLRTLEELFLNNKMAYTDILVQSGQNIRILTPGGWTDVGAIANDKDVLAFAQYLTDTADEKALFKRLSEKGACNVGCMINNTRVRVDVSLVTSREQIDFDFPSSSISGLEGSEIYIHKPLLELCIRPHLAITPLVDLGFPTQLREILQQRSGLILVTGQTGSGKTSTCASALEWINQETASHVITIQDPIEYLHEPAMSVFSDKEVGRDVPSFATATYNALRQRPDVIFISELRDAETCKQAFYAAQSSLVIATTHAPTFEEGLERILNFFPHDELSCYRSLRSSLRCMISQALLPSNNNQSFAMFYEYVAGTNPVMLECLSAGAGFAPVRAALAKQSEILIGSSKGTEEEMRRLVGLVPMNASLANAVEKGAIKLSDARRATPDLQEFTKIHVKLFGDKQAKQTELA